MARKPGAVASLVKSGVIGKQLDSNRQGVAGQRHQNDPAGSGFIKPDPANAIRKRIANDDNYPTPGGYNSRYDKNSPNFKGSATARTGKKVK